MRAHKQRRPLRYRRVRPPWSVGPLSSQHVLQQRNRIGTKPCRVKPLHGFFGSIKHNGIAVSRSMSASRRNSSMTHASLAIVGAIRRRISWSTFNSTRHEPCAVSPPSKITMQPGGTNGGRIVVAYAGISHLPSHSGSGSATLLPSKTPVTRS